MVISSYDRITYINFSDHWGLVFARAAKGHVLRRRVLAVHIHLAHVGRRRSGAAGPIHQRGRVALLLALPVHRGLEVQLLLRVVASTSHRILDIG